MKNIINNPKAFLPFMWVGGAALVRIIIYAYVGIKGLGVFEPANYAGIFINLVLYVFVFFYAYKYCIKEEYISLNPLIFKYGVSDLATLMGLRNDNNAIFMLTAIMVFIVPYVSDNLHVNNKSLALKTIAVLGLSMAVSILYIMYPSTNYLTDFGDVLYSLDALNPTVEWVLIAALLLYKRIMQQGK